MRQNADEGAREFVRRFNDLRRDVGMDDGTARDLMIGALNAKTLQQLEGVL